jgi:hypothetical protein
VTLFLALTVPAFVGAANPADGRNQLAAFLSAEYLDAAAVVREPVGGGKVMLKSPLPATSPGRNGLAVKTVADIAGGELETITRAGLKAHALRQLRTDYIDRAITAERMDRKFFTEWAAKADFVKLGIEDLPGMLGLKDDKSVAEEMARYFQDVFVPVYEVGLAQRLRADEANRFEATVQGLWDAKLYARVEAAAGPAFGKPAVEVVMSGRGNERLRRTWFFPTMKAGQTFVLYVNDRAFGQCGYPDTADLLAVEVRAACDQGKQPARQYRLAKDGKGHLAQGTVTPVSAEAASDDIRAAALFRALAAKGKAVTFSGSDGKRDVRYELRFAEATEPLRNMANRPLVQPGQYMRVSLTDLGTKKVTELDGHPEGAFGKLVLLSHGALNAASNRKPGGSIATTAAWPCRGTSWPSRSTRPR